MRSVILSSSEFTAGATAPPGHVQLPLLDELLEQIGRLVFAQIPQFDNVSTSSAAMNLDMVGKGRFRVGVQ
jgi:hypothetical protein